MSFQGLIKLFYLFAISLLFLTSIESRVDAAPKDATEQEVEDKKLAKELEKEQTATKKQNATKEAKAQKELEKVQAAAEKEKAVTEKALQKEQAKLEKQKAAEVAKTQKQAEKEQVAAQKLAEKEQAAAEKQKAAENVKAQKELEKAQATAEKALQKEQAKLEKQKAAEVAKAQKQVEKLLKKEQVAAEKEKAKLEKEAEKEQLKAEKLAKKEEAKAAKAAQKTLDREAKQKEKEEKALEKRAQQELAKIERAKAKLEKKKKKAEERALAKAEKKKKKNQNEIEIELEDETLPDDADDDSTDEVFDEDDQVKEQVNEEISDEQTEDDQDEDDIEGAPNIVKDNVEVKEELELDYKRPDIQNPPSNSIEVVGIELEEQVEEKQIEVVQPDVGAPSEDLSKIKDELIGVKDKVDNEVGLEEPKITSPNVTASDGSDSEGVLLEFEEVQGATSYRIYRSQYSSGQAVGEVSISLEKQSVDALGFDGDLIEEVAGPPYLDSSSVPGVYYFYGVSALVNGVEFPVGKVDSGLRKRNSETDHVNDYLDTDGDGVSDDQEIVDGTDPADSGSFITHLRSPAFTKYNTFLNQLNWLELVAAGELAIGVKVSLFDSKGKLITKPIALDIPANKQYHLDIHSLVGRDKFGLIKIEFDDSNVQAKLHGRLSVYRSEPGQEYLPDLSKDYSFAYSRELRNSIRGITYAVSNTYDPLGVGNLMPNWLEIVNLDSTDQVFSVRIYDQAGNILHNSDGDKPVVVPAYGEIDLQAGHEFGENYYLIEIVPREGNGNYLASVMRYSTNSSAVGKRDSFNYAFPIEAVTGTGERKFMMSSNQAGECWSQSNWLEIANVRNSKVSATFTVYASSGKVVGQTEIKLTPHSQQHFNAGAMLPYGDLGFVELTPSDAGSLVAQSTVYYHDCEENKVQSAFTSTSKNPLSQRSVGSYNTVLEMDTVTRIFNISGSDFRVSITADDDIVLFDDQLGRMNAQENRMSEQLTSKSQVGAYGNLVFRSGMSKSLIADVLRIRFKDGKVDFSFSTSVD
jgi:hypothetical protein